MIKITPKDSHIKFLDLYRITFCISLQQVTEIDHVENQHIIQAQYCLARTLNTHTQGIKMYDSVTN